MLYCEVLKLRARGVLVYWLWSLVMDFSWIALAVYTHTTQINKMFRGCEPLYYIKLDVINFI